ncbi:MAG: aminotransferase class IV [Acidobacteriota bacterium]|nr:aminotransferase class IV [Blastocatellia bacterium]MDW8412111.1 aminotransferase class IV [Acidobacteriota bacterium]
MPEKLKVWPLSGALAYGYGVFTTLRISRGKPFLYGEHWRRLEAHAERINLALRWTESEVLESLTQLIAANCVKEGRARINLLQVENLYWHKLGRGLGCDLLIFTAPLAEECQDVRMTISSYKVSSSSPLAGVKSLNYLQPMLTLQHAKACGYDEAVVLNENAEIVSAALANIFWIGNETLYTPALSVGCLAGITRELVLKLACSLKIEVVEAAFRMEHLLAAEEVFISSSVRGLTRVALIGHQRYEHRSQIYTQLLKSFHEIEIG